MNDDKSVVDRHLDELTKLTTTDQLDVKWILLRQFTVISDLMRAENYSFETVQQGILMLHSMIPNSLMDDEFKADVEESYREIKIDMRSEWCGQKVGAEKWEITKELKPFSLLRAITNLFDRTGLWLRKTPKTVFRGSRYGG